MKYFVFLVFLPFVLACNQASGPSESLPRKPVPPAHLQNPGPDWMLVGSAGDAFIWLQKRPDRRTRNTVQIWEIVNWDPNSSVGQTALSVRSLRSFDCENRRVMTHQNSWHSGFNADGRTIRVDDNPSNWRFVAPGTMGHLQLETVCQLRR
jgi:hypothetical protein